MTGFAELPADWLAEYNKTPVNFTLVENHNQDSLLADALNSITNKATGTVIMKLAKSLDSEGNIAVTYKRGKYGRWFADGPCSTKLWKLVRWGSLPPEYIDVDGVNCFPTLAEVLCKLHDIKCHELSKFIAGAKGEGRRRVYESLCVGEKEAQLYNNKNHDNKTPYELAKQIMNVKFYGGGRGAWKEMGISDPFKGMSRTAAGKLVAEWQKICTSIVNMEYYNDLIEWSKTTRDDKKSTWHEGCGFSLILQTLEALCVHKFMTDLEAAAPGCVKCYEYDGILYDEKLLPTNESIRIRELHRILRFEPKCRGVPLKDAVFNINDAPTDSIDINDPIIKLVEQCCAAKIANIMSSPVAILIQYLVGGKLICTDTKRNTWLEFKEHRWQKTPIPIYYIDNILIPLINGKYRNANEFTDVLLLKLSDISFKKKVVEDLSHRVLNSDIVIKMDTNPDLLGFTNGVYDLAKGELRDGVPEDMVSMNTGYDYIPEIPDESQDIYTFLKQVFPISSFLEYFLDVAATYLEGRNRAEELAIWMGEGGNGKSKVIKLLSDILGQYACALPTSVLTGKSNGDGQGASPFLATLVRIRLLWCSEDEKGSRFNAGLVKKMTGNDVLPVRGLFADPITITPTFKLVLLCNGRGPKYDGSDRAWIRRLRYLNYVSQFVDDSNVNHDKYRFKRNDNLDLESFKLPLLNILLDRYARWRAGGYQPIPLPEILQRLTDDIVYDNDPVKGFIAEHVETSEKGLLLVSEFYNVFKAIHGTVLGRGDFERQASAILGCQVVKVTGRTNRNAKCWPGHSLVGAQPAQSPPPDQSID